MENRLYKIKSRMRVDEKTLGVDSIEISAFNKKSNALTLRGTVGKFDGKYNIIIEKFPGEMTLFYQETDRIDYAIQELRTQMLEKLLELQ